jgi:hypothetical protein
MAGARVRVDEHAERCIRSAEQAETNQDEGADEQQAASDAGRLHQLSALA